MTVHETPADARAAASLMFLRDGAGGLEVLMLRRAERADDMQSGVCVFPGGVLDAADRQAHRWVLGADDAQASARLGLPTGGLDYLVAAVRESFEEVGLLLACRADGSPAELPPDALHPWRQRLQQAETSMALLCAEFDLRLDLRSLHYHSHWLTPPGLPKRFDTRFFTVLAPPGQIAQADLGEAVELMWTTPQAALAPDSGFKLLPVTRRTLLALSKFERAAAAHADAAEQREIPLIMPRRAVTRQGPRVVLPDEHAYAEIARLDPDGTHPASAEIVPAMPVRLSSRIVRITAPNPSLMTGPGTNSYLVRDPGGGGWTLVDPGPESASHCQALLDAAGGTLTQILVTHTHKDHSPGAQALQRATGARLMGRRAPHASGQDLRFEPDEEPVDGQRIVLGPSTTLRVLHTPGHASNHLCYLLEEEKTLFTGDHVMQGSTVVINPPDGDMVAYLRALEALLHEDLDWFAPGHGFLVSQPHAVLRALIAHRLRREAKVLQALRSLGRGDLAALLPRVYDDVPAQMHPVAQRSLLAHLLKLQVDGAATEQAGIWAAR